MIPCVVGGGIRMLRIVYDMMRLLGTWHELALVSTASLSTESDYTEGKEEIIYR